VLVVAILCCLVSLGCGKALAAVEYQESGTLAQDLQIPISEWVDTSVPSRVVILALHGFMLHGGKFDKLAHHLASHGAIVVAPDLRGFGRFYFAADKWAGGSRMNYKQSQLDALALLRKLRSKYPQLPIVCLGESMGANLSVSLAAEHAELVDGLILSSPCAMKRKTMLHLRIIRDAVLGILCPSQYQVDLIPYAQKFVSGETLADPLVRKKAGAWEILRTLRGLNSSLSKASRIKANVQVLVLRGSSDQLCKYDAVAHLANNIASPCKVLHCAADQGHLLLEDPMNVTESESLIDDWLAGKLCADFETKRKALEQIRTTPDKNNK
jgi:alpha-beta hydrolase superfamily lysophospholipase